MSQPRPLTTWIGAHKYHLVSTGDTLIINNHPFDPTLINSPPAYSRQDPYYNMSHPNRREPEKRAEYWRSQAVWRGLETRKDVDLMEEEVRFAASCGVTDGIKEVEREMREVWERRREEGKEREGKEKEKESETPS